MSRLTPEEIVALAIDREVQATIFYRDVAAMQKDPKDAKIFLGLAKMEEGHAHKLQSLDSSDLEKIEVRKVVDLKLGDHIAEIEPDPDMDYKKALILGMQREKRAHQLYIGLAESTDDPGLKNLFNKLAKEEAKHKLFFETKFDDFMLEEE